MASMLEHNTKPGESSGLTREAPAVSPLVERDRLKAASRLTPPAPGRYLAVPDGSEVALVPLREPTTRLGRSVGADIKLEHASVSRKHALIVQRSGSSVLLDDRSMNGIYVNGTRVTEATLKHGDEIALGRVLLRYVEVR